MFELQHAWDSKISGFDMLELQYCKSLSQEDELLRGCEASRWQAPWCFHFNGLHHEVIPQLLKLQVEEHPHS